jgi:O-antigen/teichoic acid export membrane protein
MATIEQFEHEIREIQKRNSLVEQDKAWETSTVRKCAILILTYVVMAVFFVFARIERPLINALVPVLAFALSTLTLSVIKRWWLSRK